MTFLVGLAARLVGEKLAPWLAYGGTLVLIGLVVLWIRQDAYHSGKADEKAVWEAALDAHEEAAEDAANEIDDEREEAMEEWAENIREEKEKIDAAKQAGSDPFDVLFPTAELQPAD